MWCEFKTTKELVDKLSEATADLDFARLVAMARFPVGPTAPQTFIDRPNIVQYRVWGEAREDDIAVLEGLDLAWTSTAAMPAATDEAFAARLTQGVADTLAEHLGTDRAADGTPPRLPENTFELFEAAARAGGAPVVARAAADLTSLELPPDVRARAASDLAAGNVLVVARVEGGRAGWWRVDPRTGQTVGVMDNGYNNDTSEYTTTKGRPPPGPERARFLRQKMGNRFMKLSRQEYERIATYGKGGGVPEAEWAEVLELQGRAPQEALSIAEQLLRGKGPIKG